MLKVLGGYAISQRRACVLIGVDPKTVRRERPPDHGPIRVAMRDVAGQRRRFGYRRIGVMLERQGMIMNHKKLYRMYREEGLSVRRRRGRKRAWQSHADANAADPGRALVDGFCVRHVRCIAQV